MREDAEKCWLTYLDVVTGFDLLKGQITLDTLTAGSEKKGGMTMTLLAVDRGVKWQVPFESAFSVYSKGRPPSPLIYRRPTCNICMA